MSTNADGQISNPDGVALEDSVSEIPFESPALAGRSFVANAYELKCVLSESIALDLTRLLERVMQPDPFVLKSIDQRYQITTLSTDTADLSCFHRVAGYARRKFRVRRYGKESILYLERKTRRGHRVDKTRSVIPIMELSRLTDVEDSARFAFSTDDEQTRKLNGESDSMDSTTWPGGEFRSQIVRRSLLPTCLMTYERQAWFGASENGPIRFTLDRNLRGRKTSIWSMGDSETSSSAEIISAEEVICEFKFRGALPLIFKTVIQDLALSPGGFSKYRNCMSRLMTPDSENPQRTSERESHDA